MNGPRALALCLATSLVLGSCARDAVPVKEATNPTVLGGELIIGIGQPQSIDPSSVDSRDLAGSTVVSMLCDTLVTLDPETGEPKPAIAESWVVSDAGRRLVIKLRRGVKFHDGRALTADDVRYTLSRIASRDYASPAAPILEKVLGYDQVHGNAEVKEDRAREELVGVKTIENYSLQIELEDAKIGELFKLLAHPATAPVPKRTVEADPRAFVDKPVCAGPYMLTSAWTPAQPTISMQRFADYYGENTAFTRGGAGYPDRVTFKVGADDTSREQAFRAGEVDVTNVSPTYAGDGLVSVTTPSLSYLALPVRQKPFTLVGVRRALSQSIDRQALSTQLNGGLEPPARGFLTPATGRLFRDGACGDAAPLTADGEAARRSLADTGIAPGDLTVRLHFNDEYDHGVLMAAIAEQWRAVLGIQVELVGHTWEEYLQAASTPDGLDGPFRMTWAPPYVSAHQYLDPLLSGASVGKENFSRFDSGAFEGQLRAARKASSDEDIEFEYESLEDIACDELPLIPLTYGGRRYALRSEAVGSALDGYGAIGTGELAWRELFVIEGS